MENNLFLTSVIINDNKEDVEFLLWALSQKDDDFNGNNGELYLWDTAKEAGFKTNYEYVLSVAEKEEDTVSMIEKFLEEWFESDNYYLSYRLSVERIDGKLFIALAYTTDTE